MSEFVSTVAIAALISPEPTLTRTEWTRFIHLLYVELKNFDVTLANNHGEAGKMEADVNNSSDVIQQILELHVVNNVRLLIVGLQAEIQRKHLDNRRPVVIQYINLELVKKCLTNPREGSIVYDFARGIKHKLMNVDKLFQWAQKQSGSTQA